MIDSPSAAASVPHGGAEVLLRAYRVACQRDDRMLYQDLDLTVRGGEIWHIQGANGIGKTSLLRQLSGLLPLTRGRVDWYRQLRSPFLYLGHKLALKDQLSVGENLAWLVGLADCSHRATRLEALAKVGLEGYEDSLVAHLSAGQKRRLGLARLHLASARVWLLDEPFTAIDQSGIDAGQVWLQQHVHNGGAVVLTSHQQLTIDGVQTFRLTPALTVV